ncbi:hypothetical protein ATK78_0896 [Pedobacter metabolipauper]|uniref:Uncharacterized protein n=2 Tax=Pedobacter metabolipauper TaxID=425513 RepID=A0A4R6T247_9SPHI|nr:hypothetical protein ATK78_0896 [Pedobacter metabolipauper]
MISPTCAKILNKINILIVATLLSCQGNTRSTTADTTLPISSDSTEKRSSSPEIKKEKSFVILEGEITKTVYEASKSSYHDFITYDSLTYAAKDGKIVLPVKNGQVVLTDNTGVPHDENIETHKYIGQVKPIHKYVIEVHLYEDNFFVLIDMESGKKDTVNGFPYLSPDHQKIFASQFNPYETYDHINPPTQDVELFAVTKNGIGVIASKPFSWYFKEVYWKDNHTIYVKATTVADGSDFIFKKLTITEQ